MAQARLVEPFTPQKNGVQVATLEVDHDVPNTSFDYPAEADHQHRVLTNVLLWYKKVGGASGTFSLYIVVGESGNERSIWQRYFDMADTTTGSGALQYAERQGGSNSYNTMLPHLIYIPPGGKLRLILSNAQAEFLELRATQYQSNEYKRIKHLL